MSVRYAILGLLHYKDMHGYRIKEHIERNFGLMWSINYGQIYSNLKKLEEDGHVAMLEVAPSEDGGPNKKLYSVTVKGRKEFSEWLASSPERQMLMRDPFLTRFTFFHFGSRDDALRIIGEQIDVIESELSRRHGNIERWKGHGVYVQLISELGLNLNEMYLEWLKKSRDAIAEASEEEIAEAILELVR